MHIERLEEKWKGLLSAITAKTQKLKEANQQQQFNEAVKDMDFWLGEVQNWLRVRSAGRHTSFSLPPSCLGGGTAFLRGLW